jgi:hypothetical protein
VLCPSCGAILGCRNPTVDASGRETHHGYGWGALLLRCQEPAKDATKNFIHTPGLLVYVPSPKAVRPHG